MFDPLTSTTLSGEEGEEEGEEAGEEAQEEGEEAREEGEEARQEGGEEGRGEAREVALRAEAREVALCAAGASHIRPISVPDLRGFDSSKILILRGGILMSIRSLPEMLGQPIFVGISQKFRGGIPRSIGVELSCP